jgi:hypothetical protein
VRAFSVNPGVVTTEAVKATLGDDGLLAQRYGASTPKKLRRHCSGWALRKTLCHWPRVTP